MLLIYADACWFVPLSQMVSWENRANSRPGYLLMLSSGYSRNHCQSLLWLWLISPRSITPTTTMFTTTMNWYVLGPLSRSLAPSSYPDVPWLIRTERRLLVRSRRAAASVGSD